VNEYAAIQPEAAPINYGYRPPEHWPQYGAIEFKGVSLRYRSDLELVLKEVSLSIKGGEKIGIVGRYLQSAYGVIKHRCHCYYLELCAMTLSVHTAMRILLLLIMHAHYYT
jgi:hypothetical protein